MRIGTRASALAVRQARLVQTALAARGIAAELVTFTTHGDKHVDEPLPAIGGKGLFTKELETALARGKIDCAVHSLKDLPTEGSPALVLAAVLPREDPRDALVLSPTSGAVGLADLTRGIARWHVEPEASSATARASTRSRCGGSSRQRAHAAAQGR